MLFNQNRRSFLIVYTDLDENSEEIKPNCPKRVYQMIRISHNSFHFPKKSIAITLFRMCTFFIHNHCTCYTQLPCCTYWSYQLRKHFPGYYFENSIELLNISDTLEKPDWNLKKIPASMLM